MASEVRAFFFLFIRGIIERRLISKPIHILIQEKDLMEIKVPKIMELKNKNL